MVYGEGRILRLIVGKGAQGHLVPIRRFHIQASDAHPCCPGRPNRLPSRRDTDSIPCRSWTPAAGRTRRRACCRSPAVKFPTGMPYRGQSPGLLASRAFVDRWQCRAIRAICFNRRLHARRPFQQVIEIFAGERVLILRTADPPAYRDVLIGPQKNVAREPPQVWAAGARSLDPRVTFRSLSGFNSISMLPGIFRAAPCVADQALNRRVAHNDVGILLQFRPASRGRKYPGPPRILAGHQPGILLREKALGNDDIQIHAEADRRARDGRA